MSDAELGIPWFIRPWFVFPFAISVGLLYVILSSCAPIDTSPTGPPVGPSPFTNTRADTGEGSTRGGSRETTDSSLTAQSQLTPSPVDALPRITRLVMPMRNMVDAPLPVIVERVEDVPATGVCWVGERNAAGYFNGEWFIYKNGLPYWRNVADNGKYIYSESRRVR